MLARAYSLFFPAEGGAAGGSYIATAAGSLPKLPVNQRKLQDFKEAASLRRKSAASFGAQPSLAPSSAPSQEHPTVTFVSPRRSAVLLSGPEGIGKRAAAEAAAALADARAGGSILDAEKRIY